MGFGTCYPGDSLDVDIRKFEGFVSTKPDRPRKWTTAQHEAHWRRRREQEAYAKAKREKAAAERQILEQARASRKRREWLFAIPTFVIVFILVAMILPHVGQGGSDGSLVLVGALFAAVPAAIWASIWGTDLLPTKTKGERK